MEQDENEIEFLKRVSAQTVGVADGLTEMKKQRNDIAIKRLHDRLAEYKEATKT
jgi:hypothetical protein